MEGEGSGLNIGNVILGVREMERSLEFYRDLLGLAVRFSSDGLAFLSAGPVALVLRRTPELGDPGDERRTELVFGVEDIDAAYSRLRDRGVVFRVAPRHVTADQLAADFRDPDGHVLSIFGPRSGAVEEGDR